jgi:hypothetical protein
MIEIKREPWVFDRERNAARLSQRPCSIDPQHGSHSSLPKGPKRCVTKEIYHSRKEFV